MQNYLNKVFLVLVGIFIMTSCTSLKITEAYRNTVYPGVRNADVFVQYNILLSSKKDFIIKEILVGNNKIDTFSIQNLKTRLGRKYDNSELSKGSYKISFKLPKDAEANKNDTLKLIIVQEKEAKTIISTVVTNKAIHRR